ncbi:MAG: M50 family metallopeptidase [Dehalococcoidia bacterium]|nr:M50 family metallopeptidase [Dehalococcoidia bacterium]
MFAIVISALIFIAILVIVVLIHEAGHFAVAKAAGVGVLEFGLGFPPRLWGIRHGETLYTLNAVPLGGFVKLAGEEDPSEPRSLAGKSQGIRFLVMAAGPFMNAVLALLLLSVLAMIPQDVAVGEVKVVDITPGSPAQLAGILPGDIIAAADGHTIDNYADLRYRVNLKLGAQTSWLIHRGSQSLTVNLVPRFNPPQGQGATGVVISIVNNRIESRAEPFWRAPITGLQSMWDVLVLTKNEFSKWATGGSAPQVTGPLGMAAVVGEVAQARDISVGERAIAILNLTAIISLSLGIFNILPIPALDGGRILFVAIEWVRRGKRIPPQKEGLVHMVGFVLLITLVLIITFADVSRIIRGESLLGG